MKLSLLIFTTFIFLLLSSCSRHKLEEKGFAVNPSATSENEDPDKVEGINKDSVIIETRPSGVLLTGLDNIRLTTIYKVNYNKRDGTSFIASDDFLFDMTEDDLGNNWNGNIIPGFEGVYGYNMVNISLYDIQKDQKKQFFEKPVLVKTLYYPSFSKDTLNYKPVHRNFFLISVYNEDSNKDGFINVKDLRRFFLYNSNGELQKQLIPENYSVFKSKYDPVNDFMFVFARLDLNKNGQIDDKEPINIFWIDLKDPMRTGLQY